MLTQLKACFHSGTLNRQGWASDSESGTLNLSFPLIAQFAPGGRRRDGLHGSDGNEVSAHRILNGCICANDNALHNYRHTLSFSEMGRWVNLYVTHDQLEAEMIRDILESGGIEVVIESAKITPYPVNVGRMGEVRLLVKEEDKEIAAEILRTAPQEGSGAAPEEGP